MINSIKLINFRNFNDNIFNISKNENFIVWDNWKWKTNILESISIIWWKSIIDTDFNSLTSIWKEYFYIEIEDDKQNKIALSYDKKDKIKKYLLNWKKISKKKFLESSYSTVIFSPMIMNIMYLSPTLRRDFLDSVLLSSYPEYDKINKQYKKIVKSRNRVLKNISEGKSQKSEINYRNDLFINSAYDVYIYRFKIIEFIKENINNYLNIFGWKVRNIWFNYISKVDKKNITEDLTNYINKNIDRDIIIKKTAIWPHVDDFEIEIDWINLINYASRWEVKSIIIALKKMEIKFIEEITNKKPILIIDDLLSELDTKHEMITLEDIWDYQVFISSIKEEENFTNIIRL